MLSCVEIVDVNSEQAKLTMIKLSSMLIFETRNVLCAGDGIWIFARILGLASGLNLSR